MKSFLRSVAGSALLVVMATSSYAYSFNPFASYLFEQSNKPYKFTNAGSSSKFGLTSQTGVPVSFRFSSGTEVANDLVANGYGTLVGSDISANLVFLNANAPAAGTLDGSLTLQPVTNVSFSIVASSGQYAGKVLLGGTSDNGLLDGRDGTGVGSLDLTDDVPTDNVTFTSDFVNLDGPKYTAQAASFTTSNFTGFSLASNGWLNSGTGAFNGNFSIAQVPEPGTLAMLMGFGVAGSLFVVRRRRHC